MSTAAFSQVKSIEKKFVEDSYKKIKLEESLKTKASFTSDSVLMKQYIKFNKEPTQANYVQYKERVAMSTLMRDIRIVITVKTDNPGAVVKYKPIASFEAFTGENPTNNCQLKLPISHCIFWTERNGKKTSNEVVYHLTDDTEITIEEFK
jgi:hypothetical protein